MQDFEKLGLFYLGREHDLPSGKTGDRAILYESRDLLTHAVATPAGLGTRPTPYLRLDVPHAVATYRRLAAALTISDLRDIAKRRTPRAAFDYTDGAAEGELSLARARQAFEDVEFSPRILRPAAEVDTSSTILGGPMKFTANGDVAGAKFVVFKIEGGKYKTVS